MSEKIILIHFCLMLAVSSQEFGLPGGSVVETLPAMRETQVQSLGWEDLEEGMASHLSILAWRIRMDRGAWQAIQSMGWQTGTRLSTLRGAREG